MTNTNVEICKCGDCEAAVSRAMKMCEQAFGNDECALFQAAVGTAIGVMIYESMRATLVEQAKRDGLPSIAIGALISGSVEYNIGLTENTVLEHAGTRSQEIRYKVTKWYVDFAARADADHKAKRADSPNIDGGPKA